MAEHHLQPTYHTLRVVTQRIATTSGQRLLYIVPYLATILSKSGDVSLATQSNDETHDSSDGPVLVHKLKTQISALLQDRSPEAKFSAVVLIKATVETGGRRILQGVNLWIKSLLGIISKPGPAVTKRLCVVVLTRIFILTHKYPSLVRELTTPSLNEFISACFTTIKDRQTSPRNDVQLAMIQAFAELVPHHPASFRPFSNQIKALCLPLVAPTPSDIKLTDQTFVPSLLLSENARRLYVLLSVSAPKNASSEAWASSIYEIIECTHRTANLVFRALIDDVSISLVNQNLDTHFDSGNVVQDSPTKEPDFMPWTGIAAGIERLNGLLQSLGTFISTPSAVALVVPIGKLVKVIERILSAVPPIKDKPVRTQPEASREECETLFVSLPILHISALNLCSELLSRMGRDAAGVSHTLLEQILWTLDRTPSIDGVRTAAYKAISHILELFGASLQRSHASGLSLCFGLCCGDILRSDTSSARAEPLANKMQSGPKNSTLLNSDHHSKTTDSQSGATSCPPETKDAAIKVLSSALTHLPQGFISSSLRQKIDRTAILSNAKDVMFASTMNPPITRMKPSQTSSLMPFLARSFPNHPEIEALIRPRMPPLQNQHDEGLGLTRDEEVEQTDHPGDNPDPTAPQMRTSPDGLEAAELKRHREPSESDIIGGNGDMLFIDNGAHADGWSPASKRHKILHEESVPALVRASTTTQSTGPIDQHEHVDERPNNDDQTSGNPTVNAAEEKPITNITPLFPDVPILPTNPETHLAAQEIRTAVNVAQDNDDDNDDSDSDNFDIPVLEMDSGFLEDEDDEDEDEEEEEEEENKDA